MRPSHLGTLCPHCPVCATEGHTAEVTLDPPLPPTETPPDIVQQGTLRCQRCTREFPVIDGVPVLLAELRTVLRDNVDVVTARDDLSPALASLVGDALGPGTSYDTRRSHLSSYGWGHWGDLDPEPVPAVGHPAALLNALDAGLAQIGPLPNGVIVDAGCALGRSTYHLARQFPDRTVLGVDASLSFLRVAQRTLADGVARYPARRVGVVYTERTFPVPTFGADRVDFWAADAQRFPFPDGAAALVTSLNLIDCVPSPRQHLEAVRDLLAVGGYAILATPFDWSVSATPIDAWIGGHSQRGPLDGTAEQALDLLLGLGDSPWAVRGLRLIGTPTEVDWWVRLHDRSTAAYRVRVTVVQRT